jgi:hypothetical protein
MDSLFSLIQTNSKVRQEKKCSDTKIEDKNEAGFYRPYFLGVGKLLISDLFRIEGFSFNESWLFLCWPLLTQSIKWNPN